MVGRMIETKDWDDVLEVMFRLVRDYDVTKDTQLRLLGKMIDPSMDSYLKEKKNAGEAGRSELKWEEGANWYEKFASDRGQENWHYSLKTIEQKVDAFRILTAGNFTDREIGEYLNDKGLRAGEVDRVLNGEVHDMQQGEFEFKHRPRKTQTGTQYMEDFWKTSTGPQYRTLYEDMKKKKYVVGEYKTFKRRAKNLRDDIRKKAREE